jgi:hypothetical protein
VRRCVARSRLTPLKRTCGFHGSTPLVILGRPDLRSAKGASFWRNREVGDLALEVIGRTRSDSAEIDACRAPHAFFQWLRRSVVQTSAWSFQIRVQKGSSWRRANRPWPRGGRIGRLTHDLGPDFVCLHSRPSQRRGTSHTQH